MRFIKPDFTHSILNISATLAEFLGAPNDNATLDVLKRELDKNYKNVVYMCFDGMGVNPLRVNLPATDFLHKNTVAVLTSTFPSTTTNATTSLCLNKLPLEHGWFGWSLYFDDVKRNIDIYLGKDSQTGDVVDYKYPIADDGDCYFYHGNGKYRINTVFPSYVNCRDEGNVIITEWSDIFAEVKRLCAQDGNNFIYAYCPQPDGTMHQYGVTSDVTRNLLQQISQNLHQLQGETHDTLFIVSADHGQIDVGGVVEFYKDAELNDMLLSPPFLDSRTPAFRVKKGCKTRFAQLFRQRYGKDFVLYRTADLLKRGYFGDRGAYGYLLGDFIAIGTGTNKIFMGSLRPDKMEYKGHHASLTLEMQVPLILFNS